MKAISALDHDGQAMRTKQRFLRAAKIYAAAAARARALPRGDDSLIVARMLGEQAWSFLVLVQLLLRTPTENGAALPGNEGADALACFLKALSLLSEAADIIRQRRAAGTLLRRTCRPEEEAQFRYVMDLYKGPGEFSAGRLEAYGEDTLFLAGSFALVALVVSARVALSGTSARGLMMGCVAIYEDARDLMELPRDGPPLGLTDQELYFAKRCRSVFTGVFCLPLNIERLSALPDVWPIAVQLQQEWLQLQRSPAFLRAISDEMQQSYWQGWDEWDAHFHDAAAAQRKHTCARCGVAEAVRGDFKACGRCRALHYCCKEHQVAHWKTHKKTCVQREE